ncbi:MULTISPECIES: ATP-binding protein [unclassified Desulfovibrio]|uniref:tRNA lysidine(34) synthetase n=1 Tax=unclassified Desulfovibrio TaxID=2593640 RepID=UPI000F5FF86A|nr:MULTISPECIES: tRNA 2-thiocytidine biosynthesis TtcA family protein [unclassified Desulfovibrio]RRD70905.1 tRNA 2-thiocytidine biosynthesis protein TtcA [Desulfovibrio sp. OH1209_COT-279]RRD87278.1 tRNA 2-thiocytidine biosynthesis protein TtcA [Desulfovibrio sp. OH1186_COT-070]
MSREKRSFSQEHCVKTSGKAMQKTAMLWPGCRVGVAVSGGVDSFVLLKTLKIRQGIVPFRFELMALHLNPGFDAHSHAALLPWLAGEGIAAHVEVTSHGPEAHSAQNLRRSACFRCSWLRRKRLFELCARYRLTHLALGHNAEDLVQTFFLNLCRNGRVSGMGMNEAFFGGGLRLIRPLLLVEKKHILKAAKQWGLPVWANSCPSAGATARSAMAGTLEALYSVAGDSRRSIFNALARWQLEKSSPADAWEFPHSPQTKAQDPE